MTPCTTKTSGVRYRVTCNRVLLVGSLAFSSMLLVPSPASAADPKIYSSSSEVRGVPVERLSTRVPGDNNQKRVEKINGSPPASAGENSGGKNEESQGASETSSLWELYSQLEALQQEMGQLRGTIENQSREIESLKRQQKEHYIDLDNRIGLLGRDGAGSGAGINSAPVQVSPSVATTSTPTSTSSEVVQPPVGNESDLYNNAIELVRAKKLDQAEQAFKQFLSNYPKSIYTANAHYWLGEVYLAMAKPDFGKARMHFETVTVQFPEHTKASACLYKLGLIHNQLGDKEKAKSLFQKVIAQFPTSPAADLARKSLATISY